MTFLRGSPSRTFRLVILTSIVISTISYFFIWTSRRTVGLSRPLKSSPNKFPKSLMHVDHINHTKKDIILGEEFPPGFQPVDLTNHTKKDISPGKEFPEGFQPVDLTNQTYVFSAYIDVLYRGSPGLIRIVALSLSNQKGLPPLLCIMSSEEKKWLVDAEVNIIAENHGYRYSAAFIICPLNSSAVPSSVSVVSSKEKFTLNNLIVSPLHHGLEVNFTVCVAPLHRNYDHLPQLIEFLEVNKILGANKLIFYNHSVSSRVSDILNGYIGRGLVEFIDWHLPFQAYTSKKGYFNVHYFGQLAAANDCLYRNRYKTQYIVSVDLDEFLIPRLARSWFDLKTSLMHLHPSAGAFKFRSYLFYTFLTNHRSFFPQKVAAEKYNSLTLLKTNRTLTALPFNLRPKYFYDPKRVSCVGIHNVWNFLQGFVNVDIGPDICSINHYRSAMVSPNPSGTIVDMYMHNYQDEIANRLNIRWTEIFANQSKQLTQSKNRV